MFSYNRVSLIGYQTQPVSLRQTPGGTSVTDLNLVVPHSFRPENGETVEGKSFHTITLWGAMADIAGRYVRAGGQLFISGRLQTDSWEDEKTNEKKSKTKIVALDMIILDPKDGLVAPLEHGSLLSGMLNRAEVIGNVTKDPEMRTTTSGQQVLTLGVATNEKWKDKASGTDRERAEFHSVVVWGPLSQEIAKSVKKGNRVYVSGRVQTRSWETKEGQKRTTTEIIADTVTLLGTRHPLADGAIQADATPARVQAAKEKAVAPSIDVPEIAYASEIKVEDLPF